MNALISKDNNEPEKGALTVSVSASAGKESQLTLGLLQAIEQKDDISQRHLAQEMGVALGLANSYLKRCVKKGWIKMTTAPANRYLYYVTPNGFAEKARLTADFFTTSLALFKQSGDEYSDVFAVCADESKPRVLLVGLSDLTEIALMRSMQSQVSVIAIYQPNSSRNEFFGVPVRPKLIECGSLVEDFDVIVMSSMEQTNELLAELEHIFGASEIKVPELLVSMNYRNMPSS
jgi:DNA-binding MarR family transcriptional regulator